MCPADIRLDLINRKLALEEFFDGPIRQVAPDVFRGQEEDLFYIGGFTEPGADILTPRSDPAAATW